jgi:hypothetical protein
MLYDSPAARSAVNAYHIDDAVLVPTQYGTHRRDDRRRRARRDGRPRRRRQRRDDEPEDDGCVVTAIWPCRRTSESRT